MKCSIIEQRNPMVIFLRIPRIVINYLRIKLIYKNSYVNTKYTHKHTITPKEMNEVHEAHEAHEVNKTKEKGSLCSVSGKKYELAVYNIVKRTEWY